MILDHSDLPIPLEMLSEVTFRRVDGERIATVPVEFLDLEHVPRSRVVAIREAGGQVVVDLRAVHDPITTHVPVTKARTR